MTIEIDDAALHRSSRFQDAAVGSAHDALVLRATRARRWLFDCALPLWSTSGRCASRGFFYDLVAQDGAPITDRPNRIRVQARQTFVFAAAGRLGWPGPWRAAVEAGVAVLLGARRNGDGGPIFSIDPAGRPFDQRRDLYDRAFWLFGLAHAARVVADPSVALDACNQLLSVMEATWALPQGGFEEGDITATPPRRQNPHMHLFEAALALYEVTGDARWRALADRLDQLFATRLLQPAGLVLEHFDDQWGPAPGDDGRIVEPGHQYEWAWLLGESARLGGVPRWREQERLIAFAEQYGVDPRSGAVVDEVWADGVVKRSTSRCWPHTERIKAGLALFERTGAPVGAAIACEAFDLLMTYLDTPVPGLWRDKRGPDGTFLDEPAPASSFYHLMMAFTELTRVAQAR